MTTEIEIVPCLSDNYAYLVKSGEACAVVDPSEAAPVQDALAKRGWKLTHILNTHHHLDHCGGNLDLKAATGAIVICPARDAARIPGVDENTGWEWGGH
jgi:hydroxyacylglutathione hydrolase